MYNFLNNFNLYGGILVYFSTLILKNVFRRYIPYEYRDPIFLLIAILLSIIYGLITHSFVKGWEAFAGSQVIHALIKKGIFFNSKSF